MKKCMYLLAIAMIIVACQPNNDMNTPFKEGQKVVLTARLDADNTGAKQLPIKQRVAGKDNGTDIKLIWNTDDQIKVTVGGQDAVFTLISGEETSEGTFEGIMPANGSDFTVTYPATYSDHILANQTYVKNGFGNGLMKMTGRGNLDDGFSLSAANALMGLTLKGNANITKVVVTNKSTPATYTLTCTNAVALSDTATTVFYLVVPAGSWAFKAEVYAEGISNPIETFETSNPVYFSDTSAVVMDTKDAFDYELRVLTFEDKDKKFEPYTLDYVDFGSGKEITTWSDLIDDPQYGGPLTYGDYTTTMYHWYDKGNTELTHTFPDNYAYCFWGGGHAISNYWGEGYSDEDRDIHIAKYYGEDYVTENAGNDQMLGWFNLQLMIPVAPHSGENFAVHYGYKDFFSYVQNLPELAFEDGVARVIDHMYVTNTNYTLNQLVNGVKSEAGNTFGGNWEGLNDDAWLKLVAYGFADIDADAKPISEVEFYLVQGTDVVTDWKKWDLSALGKVKKVRFNFLYSEDMGGRYGFTIPGYFAYDDVAVRFEKN